MASLGLIVAFASAARQASFAGAARELGLSPSAVAKNIARLEAQMGVRLFHRTTRQVSLTADGEALYGRCQKILEDVDALEAAASGARATLRGTLRIDMPVSYGRLVVLPMLAKLKDTHPELHLDARFSDHTVDLVKEGLDAAIRIGPLSDSSLVARPFDQQTLSICASPAYLRRHGEPATPEALSSHQCLLFRMPSSGRDRAWQFRTGKRSHTFMPGSSLRLGDGDALVDMAVAGAGIIQAPSYLTAPAVKRGKLKEILVAYRPQALPISLVYPSQRHVPLRVRALSEALAGLHRGSPGAESG